MDLESRKDIDALMARFYERAIGDDLIGYFFTDVAKLDLEHHLPVIGDFWEAMLFGTADYRKHGRNPLQVHAALHVKEPMRQEHFDRWLEIFDDTVASMYEGRRADVIRMRARMIAARIMEFVKSEE